MTAELLTSELATVVVYPSWWRWLFLGKRSQEFFVERVPSINGGFAWLDDKTGRPVEADVQAAIDDELMFAARRGADAIRRLHG